MTDLEKAINFIHDANMGSFFDFLDSKKADSYAYNNLKQEFIRKTYVDTYFPERCETFARDFFKEYIAQTKFLTDLRRSTTFQFVGRQDYLEKLQARLAGEIPVVLVNGTGGEGKTTLAREYAHRNREKYDYIVWLEQISTLCSAFADNQELTADLGFRQEPIEERFNRVMQKLRNLQGNNLLVIDNYTQITEEKGILNDLLTSGHWRHWRMLFTSREQVSDFGNAQIILDHLSETDALQLFKTHCEKTVDEQELKELLKLIDYHALTVELLAKNYQESWDFKTIGEVTRLLEAKSIDDVFLQELIEISRNAHTSEQTKVYDYLLKIFAIEPLQEDEIFILKQFAVLPPLPIGGKEFLNWIQDTERKYRITLTSLAKKGWLAYNTENNTFKMHHLVQMVLLKRLKPSFEDCKNLCVFTNSLFNMDKFEEHPVKYIQFYVFIDSIVSQILFNENNEVQFELKNTLAIMSDWFGFYEKATNIYEKHLKYAKMNIEEYMVVISNLASSYYKQNRYRDAKKMQENCLEIITNLYGFNNLEYARLLNNYGETLRGLEEYAFAEDATKKALNIYGDLIGKDNGYYAGTLNNLGGLYFSQNSYKEAKNIFKESLDIRKNCLEPEHPHIAQSLWWMGSVCFELEEFIEAKMYISEAYTIFSKTLTKKHIRTVNCGLWLERIEAKLSQTNK